MSKISAIVVVLMLILSSNLAYSKTVTVTKNVNPYGYNNLYQNQVYSADLNRIEDFLFGRTFTNNSTLVRLNRIEQKLYSRNYSSKSLAERMNYILSNYRNDQSAYYSNYLSDYYDTSTPINRIRNRLIGTPTGFTPPIYNYNYGNLNGINRSFSSNRGYAYNNSIPMSTGAGIHILP
ncbi:MAG: hypothetical protein ACI37Q_02565 [Candidatus Gastranaerophilaceae bacterium]